MILDTIGWLWGVAPSAVLLAILIVGFLNPEKVEKWTAMVTRAFSSLSQRAERATVARDIQGRITEFRGSEEVKAVMPYGLKITWEKGETVAELKNGEVLIVMNEHKDQARNFLTATMAYLAKGLLPSVRPYSPPKTNRAMELIMANKIISKERIDAVPLLRKLTVDELGSDADLLGEVRQLERIDFDGLFTRVFLREMKSYGEQLSGTPAIEEDWIPVRQLGKMLLRLVTKPPGVDMAPFVVKTENLGVCIALVAKTATLAFVGTDAHVRYVDKQASTGIAHFYVWGRREYFEFGREAARKLVGSGRYSLDYEEVFKTYRGKRDNYLAALHLLKPDSEAASGRPLAFEEEPDQVISEIEETEEVSVELSTAKGRELLGKAIDSLPQGQTTILGSQLGQTLRKLDPGFRLEDYGVRAQSDFLDLFPDLIVRGEGSGGDFYYIILKQN